MRLGIPRAWLGYVAEVGAILLGIMLSYLAEEWRQNQADKALAMEYKARLQEDLQFDVAELKRSLALNQNAVHAVDELLNAATAATLPPDTLAKFITQCMLHSFLLPRNAGFEALKATGNLHLLSPALQRQLLAVYEYEYRRINYYDESNYKIIHENLYPILFRKARLQESAYLMLGKPVAAKPNLALLQDAEFANVLITSRIIHAGLVRYYSQCLLQCNALLQVLTNPNT